VHSNPIYKQFLFFFLTALLTGSVSAGEPVIWTLSDVRRIAAEQNPDLKAARATYEAASKRVGQAVSGYLPHLDVNAKSEESTLPSPSAGSSDLLGIAEPYTAAVVAVRQTIFDFGKVLNRIEQAGASRLSSEQDAIAVRDAVDLGVQSAFYNMAASAQLVLVAQKSVEQYQEVQRRAEALVRTGARPLFDLSQAKVEFAKARLGLINARNAQDLARVSLLNFMGMDQATNFTLSEGPESSLDAAGDAAGEHTAQMDLEKLKRKAIDHRPEMLRERFGVEAARYNTQAEAREYFPTLDLQGWYGKYLPEYPDTLRDAWGVGVALSWHPFDGLYTTFRVAEASALADRQDAVLEKERQAVLADVTADFLSLAKSEESLQVSLESDEASKENLRLARKRYDASMGTILELLIAEASVADADSVLVQARYRHAVALATLKRAVNAPLVGGPSE
jgi:outer membrane protein TolC